MVVNDEMLRAALSRLYDHRTMPGEAHASELFALCRQAVRDRLLDDNFEFRIFLSRLVRDLYLSEAALGQGLGIEDACEFWSWFDQTMWPDLGKNRAFERHTGTIMETAGEPSHDAELAEVNGSA
jgi:hypothetical protein